MAVKSIVLGTALGDVPNRVLAGPRSPDLVVPDALGLPVLGLVAPQRCGNVPSPHVRLSGPFPEWESAVEVRPWDARPWARQGSGFWIRRMADLESAEVSPCQLTGVWGRIRSASRGSASSEYFEYAAGFLARVYVGCAGEFATCAVLPVPITWSCRREIDAAMGSVGDLRSGRGPSGV